MTWALFVNSSNSISFDPEFNYQEPDEKTATEHRTLSGALYRYTWGRYSQFKFDIKYLSSSQACTINSWWAADTELLFMNESGTAVNSVLIMNKKKPATARIKPYDDQFKATIELGTY